MEVEEVLTAETMSTERRDRLRVITLQHVDQSSVAMCTQYFLCLIWHTSVGQNVDTKTYVEETSLTTIMSRDVR